MPRGGAGGCAGTGPADARGQPRAGSRRYHSSMRQVSRRPVGEPTRGKTAPNRLRRVDSFVLLWAPDLLRRSDGPFAEAPFVDLGFGETPTTTLESAARFRRLRPDLRVIGVEIDRDRVAAARSFADARTDFRWGGFNLPLDPGAEGRPIPARLIRAMNVLRQYDEAAVAGAWARMAEGLAPGGLLIEGTSDPSGGLWTANLLRGTGCTGHAGLAAGRLASGDLEQGGLAPDALELEGLVFGTNLRRPFDPADFRAILPKSQIHRVLPGEPIHAFLEAWTRAWRSTSAERVWGPRRHFVASAERLAESGLAIDRRRRLWERGYVVWRGASGSKG